MKRCPMCNETKALEEFNRDSYRKGNISSYCRDCFNKVAQIYRNKNRTAVRRRSRKKHREYYRIYRAKSDEEIRRDTPEKYCSGCMQSHESHLFRIARYEHSGLSTYCRDYLYRKYKYGKRITERTI